MGIVSNAMLIISEVYLALGLMYLRFWPVEWSRCEKQRRALALLSRPYFVFVMLAIAISAFCQGAAANDSGKRVLILAGDSNDFPAVAKMDGGFRRTLTASSPFRLSYFQENLDVSRIRISDFESGFVDYLQQKYQFQQPDLIVMIGAATVRFMARHEQTLFAGVPKVLIYYDRSQLEQHESDLPRSVSIVSKIEIGPTLDIILTQNPGTKRVVVVTGGPSGDRRWLDLAEKDLAPYADRIEFEQTGGLTMEDLRSKLVALPPNTAILFISSPPDSSGNLLNMAEGATLIAPSANAPVYSILDTSMGYGVLGGQMLSFESMGIRAAEMGQRILAGEEPTNIPEQDVPTVPMFDWRQLKRWGISEATLPEGSIVQFRQPTVWEQYKWTIAGVITFGVLQTLLIAWLLFAQSRRRILTDELKEREARLTETLEQLQMSAVAGNVGMWIRSVDGEVVWASDKAGEIWGFPSGVGFTQNDLIEKLHPDDLERVMACVAAMATGKEEYLVEFRILVVDGNIRWIRSQGRIETVDGDPIVRGAIVDITDLKTAETRLTETLGQIHDLSGKLMNAQEKERARLARELHDDLSQSIALLSIQLTTLSNDPRDLPHVKDMLDRYVSDIESLAGDVHRISHELHPAKLTQLGLEAALKGFCRELAAAHPLEIDFEAEDLPRDLPQDISLCLYRVTQESLQNIIKHSGAASARVVVKLESGEVRLSVSDDGNGFDPLATVAKSALGLISIDERVRAVNGEAKIISNVGAGTKIEVRVPVGITFNEGNNNGKEIVNSILTT